VPTELSRPRRDVVRCIIMALDGNDSRSGRFTSGDFKSWLSTDWTLSLAGYRGRSGRLEEDGSLRPLRASSRQICGLASVLQWLNWVECEAVAPNPPPLTPRPTHLHSGEPSFHCTDSVVESY
jgi:hypothetical protein